MITKYRGLEMRRLPLIGLILLYPGWLAGQGFGTLKKTIVLERKLPAAVKLPGNSFDVKASAEKPLDLGRFATYCFTKSTGQARPTTPRPLSRSPEPCVS
jgi:hypothetical protein